MKTIARGYRMFEIILMGAAALITAGLVLTALTSRR